jgi:hypothetical protein
MALPPPLPALLPPLPALLPPLPLLLPPLPALLPPLPVLLLLEPEDPQPAARRKTHATEESRRKDRLMFILTATLKLGMWSLSSTAPRMRRLAGSVKASVREISTQPFDLSVAILSIFASQRKPDRLTHRHPLTNVTLLAID